MWHALPCAGREISNRSSSLDHAFIQPKYLPRPFQGKQRVVKARTMNRSVNSPYTIFIKVPTYLRHNSISIWIEDVVDCLPHKWH